MAGETLSHELLTLLRDAVPTGSTIPTLSDGKPNWVASVRPEGVAVETKQSQTKGSGPQLVPAWMLHAAWDHLVANGSLPNAYLLASDGLNVKRSSAVCALLARLPDVEVASSRPIELRYRPRHP